MKSHRKKSIIAFIIVLIACFVYGDYIFQDMAYLSITENASAQWGEGWGDDVVIPATLTPATGDIPYKTSGTWGLVTASGTTGSILQSNGAAAPTWVSSYSGATITATATISGATVVGTSGVTGPIMSTDYVYVPVTAAAMASTVTNGANSGSTDYGAQLDRDYMAFDSSTTQYAMYGATIPPDWDGTYCKVIFHWGTAENSSIGDVVRWGVKAGGIGDGDAYASFTYGEPVFVSDTLLADEGTDKQTSAATANVTIANYAAGDEVYFAFLRAVGHAADTMDSEDAWLNEATVIFRTHKIISAP